MKAKNLDYKQLTIRIRLDIHKAFKRLCLDKDISMNDQINALIEQYVIAQSHESKQP